MKSEFLRLIVNELQNPPHLSRRDVLIALLPALFWVGALSARPHLIDTKCNEHPEACSMESVHEWDRFALLRDHQDSTRADQLSFMTQNLSGTLGLTVPIALHLSQMLLSRVTPAVALIGMGQDLTIIAQTVLWNGFLMEVTRLFAQRPRPFVYLDPGRNGADPANYTSFYSGHTSFVAAVTLALLFVLMSRKVTRRVVKAWVLGSSALILSTAAFRVLAGRHFASDVLMGIFMGSLVAWTIARLHRRRTEEHSVASPLLH